MDDDDDASRPPILLWLVVGVLVVIGALTVFRWVLSAISSLVVAAILIGLVFIVIAAVRGSRRSRSS